MIKVNGKPVVIKRFPNGEANVQPFPITMASHQMVKFIYDSDADFLHLMFVTHQIRQLNPTAKIYLDIPYMPYSRMDRINTEVGNLFTLKSACEFINSLKFDGVTVHEAHSDMTLALLDKCTPKTPILLLMGYAIVSKDFSYSVNDGYILMPDAGAAKRYEHIIKQYYPKLRNRVLIADKTRDFATGRITGMRVMGELVSGSDVLIIDDLCSRGGTFVMAAQELKKMGAGKITLAVAHCENTIHEGEILSSDLIHAVHTTDSILTIPHPKIKIHYKIANREGNE